MTTKIKMPEPRRKIPDLRKFRIKQHGEWFHGRKAFVAVYNKARRQGVTVRSMQDLENPNLIHFWRVS